MKLRTAALAGASLLCFATPALAGGDGWYLGLGAGWSQLKDIDYKQTQPGGAIHYNNAVRGDIAAGFKMASGFRLELEDGYARYPVKSATNCCGQQIIGFQRNPSGVVITTNPSKAIVGADGW